MQTHNTHRDTPHPPFLLSAIPLVLLIALLAVTIFIFGSDALSGPSQIALIVSTAVCILLGMKRLKIKWHVFEEAMQEKVRSTSVSVFILLIIGALAGSWMQSGIVPTMIVYGMNVLHPAVFLPSACVISGVVSLMTGSSWTTIATIGIALLGIGRALGFDDGWIAGAIISGAYFGDKISPLSDTTILASSAAGTPLFKHIKYMMLTTVPTITISVIVFTIVGLLSGTHTTIDSTQFCNALRQTYNISPWLLIVPLATGYLIYRKVSSLIVLFTSTVMASVAALIAQPHLIIQIAGADTFKFASAFKGVVLMCSQATSVSTGIPLLDSLVATGGMAGMLDTIWLILCAMCFGGVMTASGMLHSFLHTLFRRMVRTRLGIVAATVINGITMNLLTGDQYISIILSANMFREEYESQGYELRLLSRSCEDSATVTSVLIPWNTCGMTQATVLGVATLTYMPYCIFNLLSPLMSVFHAAIGWKIRKPVKEVNKI